MNRTMIFTTRYLNDDEESIFYNLTADEEKSKAVCEKMWLMALNRSIKSGRSAAEIFHIQETPEKLIGIAEIFHEEDNDYDFTLDPELLSEGFLDIDICVFLESKKISVDCVRKIFKYLEKEGVKFYANYGNCYIIEEEGSDGIVYRAIGIMHLPRGMTSYYNEWASFLTSSSICDRKDEEIILCLHSGTDYIHEECGYLKAFSDSLSKEKKTISVYAFHHEGDIDPIARELRNKNSLKDLWKKIKQ